MHHRLRSLAVLFLSIFIVACSAAPLLGAESAAFHIKFDPSVSKQPFIGRVYVMLSKKNSKQLPSGPNWFHPEPFFAVDVAGWKPGEVLRMSNGALGCPYAMEKLPKGTYWARAVMDFERGARSFARGPGNGYSKAVKVNLTSKSARQVHLTIDQVYQPSPFKETERVKLVEIESKLLSDFHKKPVHMRAGVVLPKSFVKEPKRRYPVIYAIPGFSGTHHGAHGALRRKPNDVAGVEMMYVVLDPSCHWGHHVFADSDNNGPWGRALIEELIPAIEKSYRAIGQPTARFLTGHSSGGWSSLWLQVTYPDFFGGVWSTAPDPVDFRDFQRVNVYAPGTNLFFDAKGKERPLARKGKKVLLHYKEFSDMEAVMGHGGQLGSFEAVFSPKGRDGKPMQLWDRQTGAIHADVARSWQRYDIRLILERNWEQLGPKLSGKIHVYMGTKDTFYLDGATVLLKESLARLKSDAVVELFAGKDHGSLLSRSLRQRIAREMAAQYRRHYALPKN